jgi:ankyrin repeat protein
VVEELVKAGADVNLQDRLGNAPLLTACNRGHVIVVEELVKAGADVYLQGKYDTPLIAACNRGHVRVMEELVKAGADVNQNNQWGHTPLIAAVRKGSLSTAKCLVEQ